MAAGDGTSAGVGLEGAGMAQLWARSITISGKTGDVLAGGYLELSAPLSVEATDDAETPTTASTVVAVTR